MKNKKNCFKKKCTLCESEFQFNKSDIYETSFEKKVIDKINFVGLTTYTLFKVNVNAVKCGACGGKNNLRELNKMFVGKGTIDYSSLK